VKKLQEEQAKRKAKEEVLKRGLKAFNVSEKQWQNQHEQLNRDFDDLELDYE